jgi:hypothetical protein
MGEDNYEHTSRHLRDISLRFQQLPDVRDRPLRLSELFDRQASALHEDHAAGRPYVATVLRFTETPRASWRSQASALTDNALLALGLTLDDARDAAARWHGFANWTDALENDHLTVDHRFEAAADAIVEGNVAALQSFVAGAPELVHARSPFTHRSTLLHYVAANGIENHRQWQTPQNIVAIARTLCAAGADPNATSDSYGPGCTLLGLVETSVHPVRAGVQSALIAALIEAGARPSD